MSILIFGIVPFTGELLNYNIRSTSYAIGAVLGFYCMYDYIFNTNVKFLFDKTTRSIYKINGTFFKKRLMSFDEMTIINKTEYKTFEYAIGVKKKQFLKNYSISDTFTNSKKSKQKEQEYVEKILNPILNFIEK